MNKNAPEKNYSLEEQKNGRTGRDKMHSLNMHLNMHLV